MMGNPYRSAAMTSAAAAPLEPSARGVPPRAVSREGRSRTRRSTAALSSASIVFTSAAALILAVLLANPASSFVPCSAPSSRSCTARRSHSNHHLGPSEPGGHATFSKRKSSSRKKPTAKMSSIALEPASSSRRARSGVKSRVSDFQDRMRRLVTERGGGGRKRSASSNVKSRSLPRNVLTVDSLEEYRRVVGEENDKIVVVRFYATWCKACKAMAPLFYRLASLHPDVKFVDVPVSEQNANLHQGLGVPSLPFGHVYHPASGLVEEAKLNEDTLEDLQMQCGVMLLGNAN
eukprot:CAMPEP_0183296288 /NCGR_PEP_ID=MMETSP0160_2-20130417/3910_1 /TAXON_ID=2839 ORGANISM="Odontella Sinensis, Strain Grunow 1884" /NCGR_SAMPLE_ID=MMETSP0160_2 /ASSEMBLY_ACC=CAM_ASM_000250 /LENGTH=290 /DNA_ID=CAMNT_0025457889 /DNA_START=168 /DNA_END=1041 /DNA_ORIENTATION=-